MYRIIHGGVKPSQYHFAFRLKLDLGLTKCWVKEFVGFLHEIIVRTLKKIIKNHWGRVSVVYSETCSN